MVLTALISPVHQTATVGIVKKVLVFAKMATWVSLVKNEPVLTYAPQMGNAMLIIPVLAR
jgi:hypothetical protein